MRQIQGSKLSSALEVPSIQRPYNQYNDSTSQLTCQVDMLNLVAYANQTPIFEWYMVRCGSNKTPKRQVFEKIELYTQIMLAILSS
jgi:hypothetical protein